MQAFFTELSDFLALYYTLFGQKTQQFQGSYTKNLLLSSHYLNTTFHDYETFQQKFTEAALSVFGSGYAWLVIDNFGNPQIVTTANQDTPWSTNMFPLLNMDVWEHAYYLKHYNRRDNYIKDWFSVINWERVNQSFLNFSKRYLL